MASATVAARLPGTRVAPAVEPMIAFDAVAMTFAAKAASVPALAEVSFTVAPNEFVSIVGPSGCGKSTLLRLIAGLLRPTEGRVSVAGRDPDVLRRERRIGFVFQSSVTLPWRTALQNVALPGEIIGHNTVSASSASDLIELVGLKGFEHLYPRQLSGGMRQRVAIARALSFDPSILLMDEPFGALDALTRQRLHGLLQQIWYNSRKTVVFITHDVYEAVLLSDRVLVMSGSPGRIDYEVTVDLPRPRGEEIKADGRYHRLVTETLARLTRNPERVG
jgi:NitT/TauT family transport system ATP-binding protein